MIHKLWIMIYDKCQSHYKARPSHWSSIYRELNSWLKMKQKRTPKNNAIQSRGQTYFNWNYSTFFRILRHTHGITFQLNNFAEHRSELTTKRNIFIPWKISEEQPGLYSDWIFWLLWISLGTGLVDWLPRSIQKWDDLVIKLNRKGETKCINLKFMRNQFFTVLLADNKNFQIFNLSENKTGFF